MQLDQAFRDLNIVQDFIPVTNSNRPGTRLTPTHITIHNTDNSSPGADAAAHARYVKGADAQARQVSWHYTVDDRIIYQSLPVNEVGWHSGPGNSKSIGIEICMHQGMNEAQAYDRAALLVAVLALQNGIAVPDRIVQHNFWTGKNCPRVLRDKPNGWSGFLAKVQTALAQLRSAPKAAPQAIVHASGQDLRASEQRCAERRRARRPQNECEPQEGRKEQSQAARREEKNQKAKEDCQEQATGLSPSRSDRSAPADAGATPSFAISRLRIKKRPPLGGRFGIRKESFRPAAAAPSHRSGCRAADAACRKAAPRRRAASTARTLLRAPGACLRAVP